MRLKVSIERQPDDLTCGPTCLHAVYNFYRQNISLEALINDVPMLKEGGTLSAYLAQDALERGFNATIYSFNLNIFDPTWFHLTAHGLMEKLIKQRAAKKDKKLRLASSGYIEFLKKGGQIKFEDLTVGLLEQILSLKVPIIVGLSATYLYRTSREDPVTNTSDDVSGKPSGHFVLITAINKEKSEFTITDPYFPNPLSRQNIFKVNTYHLLCAILLGVLTYDANLLVITKKSGHSK